MQRSALCLLLTFAGCSCAGGAGEAGTPSAVSGTPVAPTAQGSDLAVVVPGGEGGIGFDDLRYSAAMRRVLAPGGRSGVIALIDPTSGAVETIGGFSQDAAPFVGGHDFGVTSVDVGRGFIFATDRTAKMLHVVDPNAKKIVSSVKLGASPDYVRYVAKTNELWVAEPSADRLEIFSLSQDAAPVATSVATIAVSNGPESLVIDEKRGRAYTHRWDTTSLSIDLTTRTVVAEWKNGCLASRGIDLDVERGFLFAVCNEGRVTVLDVEHGGAMLGSATNGGGYDVAGYDPKTKHLYAAGGSCMCLSIFAVQDNGSVALASQKPASSETHCVVADDQGHAWVCDPKAGAVVRIGDDTNR